MKKPKKAYKPVGAENLTTDELRRVGGGGDVHGMQVIVLVDDTQTPFYSPIHH